MFTTSDFLALRTAYSKHVLSAHRGNFTPLTLGQFAVRALFVRPLFVA